MASAVGIAVLDAIEEDKCQQTSKDVGTYFIQELAKLRDQYTVNIMITLLFKKIKI